MLTKDKLKTLVPSAFSTIPSLTQVTEKYSFIPTERVIDIIQNNGWEPVRANQVCSLAGNHEYQKHIINFRHPEFNTDKVGDEIPELVLLNAHNGQASFRLMLGIYRLVCSNGMIVNKGTNTEYRIRHLGYTDNKVEESLAAILKQAPKVLHRVDEFKALELSHYEATRYASKSLHLRYPDSAPINELQLLTPRRQADRKFDLWTVFNRVQENLMRGGLPYVQTKMTKDGLKNTRNRTRAVKAIDVQVKLNQSLWELTEKTYKQAA